MADSTPLSGAIMSMTDDIRTIVKGEIELVKAEMIPQAKKAGVGAGLFGAAGVLGINGATFLLVAAAFGVSELFIHFLSFSLASGLALGFVTTSLVLFLLAGILAGIGKGKVSGFKGPESARAHAEETVSAVRQAVETGQARAAAEIRERKARNRI